MNTLENLFPPPPNYNGVWQALYLEPIVGSGEKITVAIAAVGNNSEFSVIQAIRPELLECLYGNKSVHMQNMIDWLVKSAQNKISKSGDLDKWTPPFDGVIMGSPVEAKDENIDGILKQAIRFSASLSSLSLDADREEEEPQQPKKYTERWAKSINDELKLINPSLTSFFEKRAKVYDVNIQTTYGFLNEKYVANFGVLVPVRLSSSLTTVKAKILDLEAFKKTNMLAKPEKFEIIIGIPNYKDPTLSDKSINKIKENMDLICEIAHQKEIDVFHTSRADTAAVHLNQVAAA
ncbi:hypothetical protein [Endozoicomonas acroporae]|uniref:hypothetical protein n=1 Tax=Endozoicomonas acroporae TaxID=1701104 RepID=UPI003D79F31E